MLLILLLTFPIGTAAREAESPAAVYLGASVLVKLCGLLQIHIVTEKKTGENLMEPKIF